MAGGNVTFYTLPITSFGKTPQGEDINVVDVAEIQATVKQLLTPAEGGSSATTSGGSAGSTGSTPAPSSSTGKATTAPTPSVPTTVAGTGTPAPTDLTAISGGGIPCVK